MGKVVPFNSRLKSSEASPRTLDQCGAAASFENESKNTSSLRCSRHDAPGAPETRSPLGRTGSRDQDRREQEKNSDKTPKAATTKKAVVREMFAKKSKASRKAFQFAECDEYFGPDLDGRSAVRTMAESASMLDKGQFGYWGRFREMFARGAEAVISDRLVRAGRENSYLVETKLGLGVSDRAELEDVIFPWPTSRERGRIGEALDRYIAALKKHGILFYCRWQSLPLRETAAIRRSLLAYAFRTARAENTLFQNRVKLDAPTK